MVALPSVFLYLMVPAAFFFNSASSKREVKHGSRERGLLGYAVYDAGAYKAQDTEESYKLTREGQVSGVENKGKRSETVRPHIFRHRYRLWQPSVKKHSSRHASPSNVSRSANSTLRPLGPGGLSERPAPTVDELRGPRKRSYKKQSIPRDLEIADIRRGEDGDDRSGSLQSINTDRHSVDIAVDQSNNLLAKRKKTPELASPISASSSSSSSPSSSEVRPLSEVDDNTLSDLHSSPDPNITRPRPEDFNFTWPVQEEAAVVDGQIVLGALHMIHERSHDFVCGRVMEQGGIQALEATLYTLDHVNGQDRAEQLIPGVRLGILAKDDCDTDILGLEQALDFIRGEYTYWRTGIFRRWGNNQWVVSISSSISIHNY